MSHFAKVIDGTVVDVIVADSQQWCETHKGGTWIQTSYNTFGGVHKDGGTPIGKNFAGIGYTWDGTGFAAPQPFPSWTLNSNSYLWEAPTAYPNDGKMYQWDEATLAWNDVTPA